MRRGGLVALMVLCLGAVLAVSVAARRAEREQLLERFRSEQGTLADDAAIAVRRRLEAMARDARVLADLAHDLRAGGAGGASDEAARRGHVLAVFHTAASAVDHYRTVGAF